MIVRVLNRWNRPFFSDTFDPLGHYVFDDLPPDVEYSDNEMEFEFYKEDPPCTYHVVLPNEDG